MTAWKEVSFAKALKYATGKTAMPYADVGEEMARIGWQRSDTVFFTDGTALGVDSEWDGPYSEDTPGVDARPPRFYVWEPAND